MTQIFRPLLNRFEQWDKRRFPFAADAIVHVRHLLEKLLGSPEEAARFRPVLRDFLIEQFEWVALDPKHGKIPTEENGEPKPGFDTFNPKKNSNADRNLKELQALKQAFVQLRQENPDAALDKLIADL